MLPHRVHRQEQVRRLYAADKIDQLPRDRRRVGLARIKASLYEITVEPCFLNRGVKERIHRLRPTAGING